MSQCVVFSVQYAEYEVFVFVCEEGEVGEVHRVRPHRQAYDFFVEFIVVGDVCVEYEHTDPTREYCRGEEELVVE